MEPLGMEYGIYKGEKNNSIKKKKKKKTFRASENMGY
jgi:hypothetical protein